jgi:transposase
MFDIKPKTLYNWYRNYLSDYSKDKEDGKWLKNKIPIADKDTGEIQREIPVYIAKPENVGSEMTLDDKQIGKETFSIMTNHQTGKIALLVATTKAEELQMAAEFLGTAVNKIRSVSCDMSPSYLNFLQTCFNQITIVIDKFHVVKYVLDAVQGVRIRIKNQIMGRLPKGSRKTKIGQQYLSELELLKRSKYLLNQAENEWTPTQVELSEQLFEKYPELEKAYRLSEKFKKWYGQSNPSRYRITIEKELFDWYDEVETSQISEFNSVVKMIVNHEEEIINYFKNLHTNAKAENMNGKIQRFITNNYGIRDIDFTLYRIAKYFA